MGVVLSAGLVADAIGCSSGPERSAEAFCSTLRSEKERILGQLSDGQAAAEAQDDELVGMLTGLGASVQALGELRTYFGKLADVAPDEIRHEVEILEEEIGEQLDNAQNVADDPLGSLASAFVDSFSLSGQLSAVNDYAMDNCGESI